MWRPNQRLQREWGRRNALCHFAVHMIGLLWSGKRARNEARNVREGRTDHLGTGVSDKSWTVSPGAGPGVNSARWWLA